MLQDVDQNESSIHRKIPRSILVDFMKSQESQDTTGPFVTPALALDVINFCNRLITGARIEKTVNQKVAFILFPGR